MKTLGKKIRLLRHQKGWSQEDVARKLDISIPAFSKIETGITDVNLSRLDQISKLFNLSIVQLLSFNDSEEQLLYDRQLEEVSNKLRERETEVIELQKKVIDLYEQLHKSYEKLDR
ncbi:DNA-binding transcriptional regulator, XRE-family HTH domain [bacterium A37T11]|nr:DNA-binding transcriptional regulator, XRE-family HTH domain [bacterium A37T11]